MPSSMSSKDRKHQTKCGHFLLRVAVFEAFLALVDLDGFDWIALVQEIEEVLLDLGIGSKE